MFVSAALSIRGVDAQVKERLRIRAASHGRSMEAEIRVILAAAVDVSSRSDGLFTTLLDRFEHIGAVELELPPRTTRARAADMFT